jgi:hypothetical protein
MKRRVFSISVSLMLVVCLLSGATCHKKVNTDPSKTALTADDVLRGAKTTGRVVAVALDEGIALEATLATNGTIPPDVEPKIKQILSDAKVAVTEFNTRIAKYDHFDADSRKLIADFLTEALGFVEKLNNEGVLKIKNPNSQLIAAGILSGARLALNIYKQAMFDRLQ